MANMKYQEFLFYIRQPFTPHQRKIVFYEEEKELPYHLSSQVAFTNLYHKYKTNAKFRKMAFKLTKEQFRKLTSSKCFYCGILPNYLFNPLSYKGKPISKKSYIYNGVDRINPKKGYIISNCVSCCSICNKMKSTLDLNVFQEKIKEIYQHQKLCD